MQMKNDIFILWFINNFKYNYNWTKIIFYIRKIDLYYMFVVGVQLYIIHIHFTFQMYYTHLNITINYNLITSYKPIIKRLSTPYDSIIIYTIQLISITVPYHHTKHYIDLQYDYSIQHSNALNSIDNYSYTQIHYTSLLK